MKYFSVHNSDLESEEFLSATDSQVATWLWLHAYCSKQLNGGEIRNAKSLPDALWTRHGISREVIHADSPLWFWEGENLILSFYDQHGQEVYEKKVAGGKERARRRYSSTPSSNLSSTPAKRPDADKNRVDEKRGELPPNPQGGMDVEILELNSEESPQKPIDPESAVLPANAKRMKPDERKRSKVKVNTPTMERIGGWFGRRPGTLWTVAELIAFIALSPSEAEISGMEAFYMADDPADELFRRRDLLTLLNNWQGELDKARGFSRKQRESSGDAKKKGGLGANFGV